MTPRRIRLSRARGWRLPEGARSVARPGTLGNPLRVGTILICEGPGGFGFELTVTPTIAVEYFTQLMESRLARWPDMHPDDEAYTDMWAEKVADLRGCDLACWCGLCDLHTDGLPLGATCDECDPCHADVLLVAVNPGRVS